MPLLYFMQAVPLAVVGEVSAIIYKDLGIQNESITRWTSLITLPWTIKLLFGPLIDLNFTKRGWVLTMQGLLTVVLALLPFLLHVPHAFEISLGTLFIAAIFSATCDIATDGFYLLALKREDQAAYVGIQSTFFRLGRLFCVGLLVALVGWIIIGGYFGVNRLTIPLRAGASTVYAASATLGEGLTIDYGTPDTELVRVVGMRQAMRVGNGPPVYQLTFEPPLKKSHRAGVLLVPESAFRFAWSVALALAAVVYGVGWLFLGRVPSPTNLPRPPSDKPLDTNDAAENWRNVNRTVLVLGFAFSAYFTLNSLVRLTAFFAALKLSGIYDLHGWILTPEQVHAEIIQGPICLCLTIACFAGAKALLQRTVMGEAFSTFARQRGIVAILAFILFYRFGEAMVTKMAPLFLKDIPSHGGLGISDAALGQINGVAGVLGIVIGGILGGLIVARFGLKKSFWPLVICMHLPNLLYLWAARSHPPVAALYGVAFVDQFGYGFGFAGYSVYLMMVAQRSHFRTAHYAIATGLGAFTIMLAGILSGKIQENFGYQNFFLFVIFATVPGMLTLLFIPMDEGGSAGGTVPSPAH